MFLKDYFVDNFFFFFFFGKKIRCGDLKYSQRRNSELESQSKPHEAVSEAANGPSWDLAGPPVP